MGPRRERMFERSRQFANILATKADGDVISTWLFGSLAQGKKNPKDADIAVTFKPTATSHDRVITLANEIAPKGRFHGIKVHPIPITSGELQANTNYVAQDVNKHKIKLWPF